VTAATRQTWAPITSYSRRVAGGAEGVVAGYGRDSTSCGGKGATLQRPSWAGNHIGFYPFPTEIANQMRDDDPTRTL
jgi:hypothetical protein